MNRLWVRLSLGFSGMVLAAVFVVALAGFLVGRADYRDRREIDRPIRPEVAGLANELAAYYQTRHSWTGSDMLLLKAQAQTALDRRPEPNLIYVLTDAQQRVIYHLQEDQIGKPLRRIGSTALVPIRADNQTVGYLGLVPTFALNGNTPPDFVRLLGRTLFSTAAVIGIGSIIFGILMSRSLTAPLNNLAEAAKAIGARHLGQRVEEKGSAEMIAVAQAFNEMAAALEEGEQLRRNLLADVAHELRTPLTVLQGNLRAILDEVYPLNQEEMVRLYEHTRFLSRLVNDLHELAQAEARQLPLDLQNTDLAELAQIVGETFRPSAEAKGVTLHTELPDNLSSTQVDPGRIRQVLQNLLANALRHTPSGGTITLRVEPEPNAVCLVVADNGEGIPADHLSNIFDRFYRTDPARSRDRGGAGLGLAIARAIVEAHGGQIIVTSAGIPGQGSTFRIQLSTQTLPSQAPA